MGNKNGIKKKPIYKKWWFWVIVAMVFFGAIGAATEDEDMNNSSIVDSTEPSEQQKKYLPFLNDFTEYGYSSKQIEDMRTILINVGITEITELEIGNVSYGMQTVKGIAYKDTSFGGGMKEVQVRFNIENGILYAVSIYCPSYITENQTPYLSGLTNRRADLYYVTHEGKGGYIKKIDWDKKSVVDY